VLHSRIIAATAGAIVIATLALATAHATGPRMEAELDARARKAIAAAGGNGITARFTTRAGWATRHPLMRGGDELSDPVRARTARMVAQIPGVGAVHWANSSGLAARLEEAPHPLHCQDDVNALLHSRTIRFQEGSASIDPASEQLVDEVAEALRPCLGSIIAVTGHTDKSGLEQSNVALSLSRAEAVRDGLLARGIPADGLRARGLGSKKPVEGLDPEDPANRRIEFSVIASVPVRPTPVDVPGPR